MTAYTANALIAAVIASSRSASLPRVPALPAANLDRYRERDFGIGYGRSSGYAGTARRTYGESSAPSFLRVG